jgi:hypothetical protein
MLAQLRTVEIEVSGIFHWPNAPDTRFGVFFFPERIILAPLKKDVCPLGQERSKFLMGGGAPNLEALYFAAVAPGLRMMTPVLCKHAQSLPRVLRRLNIVR